MSVDKFLADRHNRLVLRAKKLNIPCTITKQEFTEQFHSQQGLCFYTDIKLVHKVGTKKKRNGISIDKIVPSVGYVKGNVVFCTNFINSVKYDLSLEEIQKWMPSWYIRIQDFFSSQDNPPLNYEI